MRHLLMLSIFMVSCKGEMPKEFTDNVMAKNKKFHRDMICKDLLYRTHCWDGEVFANQECKESYTNCINKE